MEVMNKARALPNTLYITQPQSIKGLNGKLPGDSVGEYLYRL